MSSVQALLLLLAAGRSRCWWLLLLAADPTCASSTPARLRWASQPSLGLLGLLTRGRSETERGNETSHSLRSESPWATEGERERKREKAKEKTARDAKFLSEGPL